MKGERVLILILLVLLVGMFFYFTVKPGQSEEVEGQEEIKECQVCSNPGPWSECSEQGTKTRTNYECSEDSNYECESYIEEKACETELKIIGSSGLEAIITPTLDETVKGIIQVEAVAVPNGSESVVFFIMPAEFSFGDNLTEEESARILQEIDTDPANGWKVFFDTTKIENGLYKIIVTSSYEGAPEEEPWLGFGYAQVVVKN